MPYVTLSCTAPAPSSVFVLRLSAPLSRMCCRNSFSRLEQHVSGSPGVDTALKRLRFGI